MMADNIQSIDLCSCGSGEQRGYCPRCNPVSDEEIAEADEFFGKLFRAIRERYFKSRQPPSGD